MRKYMPYICIAIIVVTIIVSVIINNNNKSKDKYIYFYDSYNITTLVSEDEYLNIYIYVNNRNSYFVDEKQIADYYLKNTESFIDLELLDIKNTNEVVNYQNEKYYKYCYIFKIVINIDSEITWYIRNIQLYMRFNNNKEYFINIGDLSINKIEENEELISFTNIKPLTSNIGNNTYLTGLVIGIRKVDARDMIIKKINLLDANLNIGNRIYLLDELPYTNNFEEVADFDYSSIVKGTDETYIKIKEDPVYIFIPIHYDKLIVSNNFPVQFSISINGNIKKFTLYDYKFYEPTNYIIDSTDLKVYEIK